MTCTLNGYSTAMCERRLYILFLFLICTLAVQVANLRQPLPKEFVTVPDGFANFFCYSVNTCVTWMIDDWVVINSTMGVSVYHESHASHLYIWNSSAFNASKVRCLQPGIMSPPSVLFIQGMVIMMTGSNIIN